MRDPRLTLTVSVATEPRFMLLDVEKARVELAFDEDKKPLRLPSDSEIQNQDRRSFRDLDRQSVEDSAEVVLQRSSKTAKVIKELRGAIPVVVVVERKQKVITEKVLSSAGTKFQIGGSTLEIIRSELDEDGNYSIQLSVPPDRRGIDLRWHDRVRIEDATGNKYESNGHGTSSSDHKKEISFHYAQSNDPRVGLPSKLIIEDWVIVQYSIPFEFKDVPLP
jgi:hypothetical protein